MYKQYEQVHVFNFVMTKLLRLFNLEQIGLIQFCERIPAIYQFRVRQDMWHVIIVYWCFVYSSRMIQ